MRLYDRSWLRATKRALAAAVRERPEWRREVSRRFWKRHRYANVEFLRACISVTFFVLGYWAEPVALTTFLFWAGLILVYRTHLLRIFLGEQAQANAFLAYPVQDAWLFRWQFSRASWPALWLGLDAAALYVGLTFGNNRPSAWICAALAGALITAASSLAWSVVVFRLFPSVRWQRALVFTVGFLLSALLLKEFPFFLRPLFRSAEALLRQGTPAGWVQSAIQGTWNHDYTALLYLLPAFAPILWLPANIRALQQRYHFATAPVDLLQPGGISPDSGEDDDLENGPALEAQTAEIHAASEAAALYAIESRAWIPPVEPSFSSFLDRLTWRWMNARERHAFPIICPFPPIGGSGNLLRGWKYSILAFLLFAFIHFYLPASNMAVLFILAAWTCLTLGAPLWGGRWPGLAPVPIGQRHTAYLSSWPVGFREIAGIICKSGVIRTVVAAPLFLAWGAFGGWFFSIGIVEGVPIGFRLLLVALCLQPLTSVFPLSAGTNDTELRGIGCLALLGAILFLAVPILGAIGLVMAKAEQSYWALPVILLFSWLAQRAYASASNRGWFDQLTTLRQS